MAQILSAVVTSLERGVFLGFSASNSQVYVLQHPELKELELVADTTLSEKDSCSFLLWSLF